jgi:hypothetical protein
MLTYPTARIIRIVSDVRIYIKEELLPNQNQFLVAVEKKWWLLQRKECLPREGEDEL